MAHTYWIGTMHACVQHAFGTNAVCTIRFGGPFAVRTKVVVSFLDRQNLVSPLFPNCQYSVPPVHCTTFRLWWHLKLLLQKNHDLVEFQRYTICFEGVLSVLLQDLPVIHCTSNCSSIQHTFTCVPVGVLPLWQQCSACQLCANSFAPSQPSVA